MKGGIIAVLFLFNFSLIASSLAPIKDCYSYQANHGGVLIFNPKDQTEKRFAFYHFAIFQCPHVFDVLAYVTPPPQVQKLLVDNHSNATKLYSAMPSIVLRDLALGKISSFSSDVYDGFLDNVVLSNQEFKVIKIAKGREFDLQNKPQKLTYEVFFSKGTNHVILKHLIVSPPEFDQVLLGQLSFADPKINSEFAFQF
eukprot:TRINITY_DN8572_c0_g1_i1.p1 TRINITY_DN8572_c0_g1~~TRINITY_DN8572_c0_g1_i1.p1  ORF type:complete len:198 (+),score=49.69 TRINITY_DN8572_c0_g1_i1:110-703(+)